MKWSGLGLGATGERLSAAVGHSQSRSAHLDGAHLCIPASSTRLISFLTFLASPPSFSLSQPLLEHISIEVGLRGLPWRAPERELAWRGGHKQTGATSPLSLYLGELVSHS